MADRAQDAAVLTRLSNPQHGEDQKRARKVYVRSWPKADITPFRCAIRNRYDSLHRLSGPRVRRREFIRLIGGAAAIPLAAHAQQGERIRRVAVFSSAATDTSDPEGQANIDAFLQALQQFGWTRGQNVQRRSCHTIP